MSSDREKAEQRDCLAVLAEVEQYILQGKRNPKKVGKFLQSIISEPLGGLRFGEGDDKAIIENLKMKTVSGKIKWKLLSNHSYFGPLMSDKDCIMCEEENVHYEISQAAAPETGLLRIYDLQTMNMPAHVICLIGENKIFFSMIFEGLKSKAI